jgi:hypothetical protein
MFSLASISFQAARLCEPLLQLIFASQCDSMIMSRFAENKGVFQTYFWLKNTDLD